MRITALEVDGFGIWSGLKLDALGDGLNVFFGPNEAGKTTLMQFIRSVLYGFSPERRRYLPPVYGGLPGGTLHLVGPHGPCAVSRHDRPGGDGPQEQLLLRAPGSSAPGGERHAEPMLSTILGNVEEAVFNNVFAVELRELQELGTLNDTQAAALLYRITAGLDRVSLVEVMREVAASRNRLLDRSGGPCQVLQGLAERDKLRAEIGELRTLGHRYGRLAAERDQLDRQIAGLEEEGRQCDARLRSLEIAAAVQQRWREREKLDAELAALGPAEKMPEGALRRLDALGAVKDRRQKAIDELRQQEEQLRQEAAELKIILPLWRETPRIEALGEQGAWIGTLQTRILELEAETAEAEAKLGEEQRRAGLTGQALPALSASSLAALRRPASALRRSRQELAEARHQVEDNQQAAQALEEQVRSALESRGEQGLNEATDRAGGLVGQLRRRVQIDERVEQIDEHLADLHQKSQDLLDRQMMPVSILLGLGGVFVAGAGLVMLSALGLLLSKSLLGQLGWPAALLGLAATVAAVITKFMLERSSARKLHTCQRQIRMLQLQRKQAYEERDSLDQELPEGEGPVQARLHAAERELAGLEELVPIDARCQAIQQEAEAAAARVRQAEAELAAAGRQWKEAIAAAGLPPGLSPKQVKHLASRRDEIAELGQRAERRREELAQRTSELEALTGRIARLVEEAGLDVEGRDPAEQLRVLVEAAGEQETRMKRRQVLRQQARQLRRKRARHETALVRLKRRRRLLLDRLGVASEEEFRQRAARHAQIEALRQRRDALAREIDAAIAGHCPEQTIAELLSGDSARELAAKREQAGSRLQACTAQLRQCYERRGQLAEQVKSLVDNRDSAAKQLELGIVEKRLADAVRRWKVLAVTSEVLEAVRKHYEQTRQPEALQEASRYFGRLTEGRYQRVWTPLGEDVLLVEDSQRKTLPVEMLSRGAREQLFLCLRLALAGSYGRRGAELPMVLDDVLVNFDGPRAKAAVGVLADFAAAGHQLLVFTCHEHIAGLFESLRVEVHALPEHAKGPKDLPIPARPPRARRKRKEAPQERPREVAARPEPIAQLPPWEEDEEAEEADPEPQLPESDGEAIFEDDEERLGQAVEGPSAGAEAA